MSKLTFMGSSLSPFSKDKPVVVNIILLCLYGFLFTLVTSGIFKIQFVYDWLKLDSQFPQFLIKPWTFLTYIFIHSSFIHIFSNMLWLYFIGMILSDLVPRKFIWRIFLLGGVWGGILFLVFVQLVFGNQIAYALIGASAGVTAIIVATATLTPRYIIMLFGFFPIELFWIAIIRVLFDLLFIADGINTGGFIAHLGGAAFGFLFMLHYKGKISIPFVDSIGEFLERMWSRITKRDYSKMNIPKRKHSVIINTDGMFPKEEKPSRKGKPSQDEIDEILDKINKTGYNSLSTEEKEKLFSAGE